MQIGICVVTTYGFNSPTMHRYLIDCLVRIHAPTNNTMTTTQLHMCWFYIEHLFTLTPSTVFKLINMWQCMMEMCQVHICTYVVVFEGRPVNLRHLGGNVNCNLGCMDILAIIMIRILVTVIQIIYSLPTICTNWSLSPTMDWFWETSVHSAEQRHPSAAHTCSHTPQTR